MKKIFRDESVYIVTYTSYTMHKALYTKRKGIRKDSKMSWKNSYAKIN